MQIKVISIFTILIMLITGCKKVLDEQPRSIYTPDYFKTVDGVTGGITALYANLRQFYGNGYYLDACQSGTDETTYGQNGDANFKDLDLSGVGTVTGLSSRSDVLWNAVFPNINTANGVIEYGAEAGISASLLAEARFFRAFDYFMLVQTFGGVPLDLGSGELQFNTSAVRLSVRNTVPEVYIKAIFPDLDSAVNSLPITRRVTGGVTQTLARLYLAKAYLTYAWWLANPNNIPTYPLTDRTDPDGHNAQWYFQQSYNIAMEAIANPGQFGLQPTFYDVNLATNDRNNEILLYADHAFNTQYGGLSSTSYSTGVGTDNFAGWMEQWNYPLITSSSTADWSGAAVNSVQRAAVQDLGRPWFEMAPPIDVIKNTFADKINDSRYDGTFTTVYRCNMDESQVSGSLSASYTTLYNANGLPVKENDAILSFLNNDTSGVDYSNSKYASNVGAGILPGRADYVIEPGEISRIIYPGNWKLGPYRTDNGGGLGQPNASSIRPWNIAKFSELFFIAAEAAVEGAAISSVSGPYANDGTARGLINVIRSRAGVWNWNRKTNTEVSEDNSMAMINETPATIDINYILAERSREYFGEGYRWYDLVRTQKWGELASSYTIGNGTSYSDHTVSTITRTIPPTYYIRPIPQGQLDGLEMNDSSKVLYQNPGYN